MSGRLSINDIGLLTELATPCAVDGIYPLGLFTLFPSLRQFCRHPQRGALPLTQ